MGSVVVVLPITLSLPTLVEVELGCDNSGHSITYAISESRANNFLKAISFYTTSYIMGNHSFSKLLFDLNWSK
jgi:hypothetical protein